MMTEHEMRQLIVGIMKKWIGFKEPDTFRAIIDIYNSLKPLPNGYKMTYKDQWCAATISAAAIEAGMTDLIPRECSCTRMIALMKQKGIWVEDDSYRPKPADIIFYDWQDTGIGDNTGASDHVGMVEKVSGDAITVIEGNYHNMVGRRVIPVGGKYIRGYGVPKYGEQADTSPTSNVNPKGVLSVGSKVNFTGTRQFYSSLENSPSVAASPCDAVITLIREGRSHPFHLEGSGIHGWADAADVIDPETKSVDAIATEVIMGLWGDGETRVAKLKKAGYDPAEVQLIVNQKLK